MPLTFFVALNHESNFFVSREKRSLWMGKIISHYVDAGEKKRSEINLTA